MSAKDKFIYILQEPHCSSSAHENNKILRVCTEFNCKQKKRLLCGHCILSHTTHPQKLILLKDFVNLSCENYDRYLLSFQKMSMSTDHHKRTIDQSISERFLGFRRKVDTFLKQSENDLKRQVEEIVNGCFGLGSDGHTEAYSKILQTQARGKPLHLLSKDSMDAIIHELWYTDMGKREENNQVGVANLDQLWNLVRVSLEDFQNSIDEQIKKWRIHVDQIIVRAENFQKYQNTTTNMLPEISGETQDRLRATSTRLDEKSRLLLRENEVLQNMLNQLREGSLKSQVIREKIDKVEKEINSKEQQIDLSFSKNFAEKDVLLKRKRKINEDMERLSTKKVFLQHQLSEIMKRSQKLSMQFLQQSETQMKQIEELKNQLNKDIRKGDQASLVRARFELDGLMSSQQKQTLELDYLILQKNRKIREIKDIDSQMEKLRQDKAIIEQELSFKSTDEISKEVKLMNTRHQLEQFVEQLYLDLQQEEENQQKLIKEIEKQQQTVYQYETELLEVQDAYNDLRKKQSNEY